MKGVDVVYVPTRLKIFLYAYLLKAPKILVAGPNVTGIALSMVMDNSSLVMTMGITGGWIELSELRIRQCMEAGTRRDHMFLGHGAVDLSVCQPKHADRSVWKRNGVDQERTTMVFVKSVNVQPKGVPVLLRPYEKGQAVIENEH